MKQRFSSALGEGNLTAEEQASMMADLNSKMMNINDALQQEQAVQNKALEEALARRRKKQEKLRNVMDGISDKKDIDDEHYQKKIMDI